MSAGPVATGGWAEAVENILRRGVANVLRLIPLCETQPRSNRNAVAAFTIDLRATCQLKPNRPGRDHAVKLALRSFVMQYPTWLMILSRILCTAAMLAFLPLCHLAAGRSDSKFALDGPGLTAGEKFVLEKLAAGKSADLKGQFGEGTNSVLRGAFLEALLSQPGTNVHRNGISIEHAVVLDAVDFRNTTVRYEVNLVECRFQAEVDFSKSVFENTLSLTGSTFQGPVNFSAMKIGRAVTFDQASFWAEVNASQMEVAGLLNARETHFNSRTGEVDFTSLKVTGDAFFTRATFAGPVTFQYAHFAENWRCEGSGFTNATVLANFEAVQVGATTSFAEGTFAGYVSFKDARFGALSFSKVNWPVTHLDHPWLWFNGMTYQRISAGSEKDSWNDLYDLVQRTAHQSAYSADIYANLEDYYQRLGYPKQANMFFRAQKQREREEVLTGFAWAWSFFLDWFVGYGRSPQRAIFWSVAIVGTGCLVFRPERMEPQKSEYSARKYSAFWYSVDVYLPIIKLHDAEIWKPKEEYVLGHVWRRIHTVLGWALIPIALAAWTGMLPR